MASSSSKDTNLIPGEERRPNKWNVFQGEHSGLTKHECKELYKKEKQKNPSESGRGKARKTSIRCSLDKFRIILSQLKDYKKKIIATTPFASLLELEKGGFSLPRDVIKTIAHHFNYEKMTLTVRRGSETQEFLIKPEDFSKIMGIQDGNADLLVSQKPELDAGLLDKFCMLESNNEYKNISISKVENVLEHALEDDAIKQAFVLIALHYIICPAAGGRLGKNLLWYVQNVNNLNEQPWVRLAMSTLKNGIRTYQEGKGAHKNIGGCVLFLQLYCMKMRGFMKGLKVSEIGEELTEEFRENWMIDHAADGKRKKLLASKICEDLKNLSDLIKDQTETIGLQLLLELDAFTENCMNKISSDQTTELSDSAPLTVNRTTDNIDMKEVDAEEVNVSFRKSIPSKTDTLNLRKDSAHKRKLECIDGSKNVVLTVRRCLRSLDLKKREKNILSIDDSSPMITEYATEVKGKHKINSTPWKQHHLLLKNVLPKSDEHGENLLGKRKRLSFLMELKANTILAKRAAQMDLKERCEELLNSQAQFEKAERCVKVLGLVDKKLNNNILEFKAEKLLWAREPILQPLLTNDLSPQCGQVCVQGYKVKQNVGPILEAIFMKHGDIADKCVFKTISVRASILEVVCEVVRQILTSDAKTIISEMEKLESQVFDAESAKINVLWLRAHLEAIHKRNEALEKSRPLLEMKVTTILVVRAAQMDLKESFANLLAAQERFGHAERCVRVLHLVEKKLNNNIMEFKLEKDSWEKQPIV